MHSIPLFAATLTLVSAAQAGIVTRAVEYKHGDVVLEGFLAYDDSVKEPRPGVLLVHEWWGVTEHTRNMTRQIAEMGYVAFAVDMYGKGVVTDDREQAAKLAGPFYQDVALCRARAKAGLEQLAAQPNVDKQKIAAIGFCFGGTTVLQMAYGGLNVAGVVSFHGGLSPAGEADLPNIKAKVLVLHGADDPLVKEEQIKSFQEMLRKAGADWQMIYYGGAVHSFTNPGADKVGIPGVKYDARTDKRARGHMKSFFDELFQAKTS